jgi:hypothetical protein
MLRHIDHEYLWPNRTGPITPGPRAQEDRARTAQAQALRAVAASAAGRRPTVRRRLRTAVRGLR